MDRSLGRVPAVGTELGGGRDQQPAEHEGDQDGHQRARGEGRDEAPCAAHLAGVAVVLVQQSVALAPREQPPVDGVRREEGGGERDRHPEPEDDVDQPGVHRPGDQRHDDVVDDLHGRDRQRVGGQDDAERRTDAETGLEQRQGRERVAEDEGQRHRQDDRPAGAQPDGGADHQAEDLADGAAGEAVQGGADRHRAGAGPGVVVLVLVRILVVVLRLGHEVPRSRREWRGQLAQQVPPWGIFHPSPTGLVRWEDEEVVSPMPTVCAALRRPATPVRAGLLIAVAAVVLGILGMHALSLHGTVPTARAPVSAGVEPGTASYAAGHGAGEGAHHGSGDGSDHGEGLPHHGGGVVMLCLAMLAAAAGVLLALAALRHRAPPVWAELRAAVARRVTARARPGGTGPPPVWEFSVVRC